MRYKLEDLKELCQGRVPESLTLEFKPCNELKEGVIRRVGRSQQEVPQSKDHITTELSKDISAFLNAAGGTIVYGVLEKKKKRVGVAEELDYANAFAGKYTADWLTEIIRHSISPLPAVEVYEVNASDASWFWL